MWNLYFLYALYVLFGIGVSKSFNFYIWDKAAANDKPGFWTWLCIFIFWPGFFGYRVAEFLLRRTKSEN